MTSVFASLRSSDVCYM